MPSLHILIATVGRDTLQRMLDTILPYLTEIDHLTIVFDGVQPTNINVETKGQVHIHFEPDALGYWGHGIRNKYKYLIEKTDFVMHADDDDIYLPDAFMHVRNECTDINTLYVAKMHYFNDIIIPRTPEIKLCNIGTPNGIIPYELNKKGNFANNGGGDGEFYTEIAKHADTIVFLDHIIYRIRG
jgi:hypothetical protein